MTPSENLVWAALTFIGALLLISLAVMNLRSSMISTPSKLESQTMKKSDPEQADKLAPPIIPRYSLTKPDQPAVLKPSPIPNAKISVIMDPTASPRLKRSTSRKDIGVEMSKPLERTVSKSRIIQSLDNL